MSLIKIISAVFSIFPPVIMLTSFIIGAVAERFNWNVSNVGMVIEGLLPVSGLFMIFALVYYIYFIAISKDGRLVGKKALWISVLLFGNIFAIPVFWFFYFRGGYKKGIDA
ncbi:MAG: hypothetical protein K0S46_2230 [Moraxellaceae bacterium]|nr:hypothetical protein [Moraxellaceae bacterium]